MGGLLAWRHGIRSNPVTDVLFSVSFYRGLKQKLRIKYLKKGRQPSLTTNTPLSLSLSLSQFALKIPFIHLDAKAVRPISMFEVKESQNQKVHKPSQRQICNSMSQKCENTELSKNCVVSIIQPILNPY